MFKFFVCFVIEILHHTTTDTAWPCIRLSLYLIGILHQTTTHPRHECRVFQLYLIEILHQTTTPGVLFVRFQCFMPFCPAGKSNAEPSSKWVWCAFLYFQEQRYCFLEKFQLLRHVRFCPFALAPEVENVSILFVCHRQNTRKSSRRHRPSNAIDVNLHVFFRGTMPDIHRILHHCEAVLFQRFAELCRMTPFCFGIGRQIEKDKQPHDPIGIQSRFWHGPIPTRDMIPFFVYQRSILLWKRL